MPRAGRTAQSSSRAAFTQVIGATYDPIDAAGLHVTVNGEPRVIDCDTVVICVGQASVRDLYDDLAGAPVVRNAAKPVTRPRDSTSSGAPGAAELDAKRAIDQVTRVVAAL